VRKQSFTYYQIGDAAALSVVVRQALDRDFGGAQAAAQRSKLGVSQPLLSRILSRKLGKLSQGSVQSLRRLVSKHADLVDAFDLAMIPPVAQRLAAGYERWLDAGGRPTDERWTVTAAGELDSVRADSRAHPLVEYRRAADGRRLEREYLESLSRQRWPDIFRAFDRLSAERKADAARVAIALARVFEPLLSFRESGFVERSWEELEQAGQLREVIRLGLKRERILLDRPDLVRRATRAATQNAESLREPNWIARAVKDGVSLQSLEGLGDALVQMKRALAKGQTVDSAPRRAR